MFYFQVAIPPYILPAHVALSYLLSQQFVLSEHPSAFQKKLNLLQSASSSLKLRECGIFEIDNLIKILLKSVRSNGNVVARTINIANKFRRRVVSYRNSSHPAPATDPSLINPHFNQAVLPMNRFSEGANECAITNL